VDVEWRMPVKVAPAAARSSRRGSSVTAGAIATEEANVDEDLLETLKSWRRELAQRDNVPPYVIFADKVLVAIAARKPKNEFDLLEISGIGPAKATKFGEDVLEMVRKHEN